jgi:hypothetical protein
VAGSDFEAELTAERLARAAAARDATARAEDAARTEREGHELIAWFVSRARALHAPATPLTIHSTVRESYGWRRQYRRERIVERRVSGVDGWVVCIPGTPNLDDMHPEPHCYLVTPDGQIYQTNRWGTYKMTSQRTPEPVGDPGSLAQRLRRFMIKIVADWEEA